MKKEFENCNAVTTIDCDKYSLTVLMNKDGSICHQMCWLTKFDDEACKITKKEVFTWDSIDYIWKELYVTVKSFIVDKQVTIDFEEIMQDIPVEDFKYIYELLEFGIKLGFKKDEI